MSDSLDQLRRMLPESPEWELWLAESGERPPDFATLPVQAAPPPAIPAGITTPEQWRAHRDTIKGWFTHWMLGASPPAPDVITAEVVSVTRGNGCAVEEVRVSFGPENRAAFTLWLYRPDGDGPFPVFLTQSQHRDWALIAQRRGYIGCVYAGSDDADESDSFLDAYPGYDWSRLTRRAWMASRAVDYLLTRPDVIPEQIAITGHSRNGKQALIAAAYDERIGAVIASSPGAGGSLSFRAAEQQFGEGIEWITRRFPEWFHPRWRFFVGREEHLPLDMHHLLALIAPRPLLYGSALHDGVEGPAGVERSLRALQPVYDLLGVPGRIALQWRGGGHEMPAAAIERYVDWCDHTFGRSAEPEPPAQTYVPHDWDAWNAAAGVLPRDGLAALTGFAPPRIAHPSEGFGVEGRGMAAVLGRATPGEGIERHQSIFGDNLQLDLYAPAGAAARGKPLPVVLWLHPWPSTHGYRAAYSHGEQVYELLARAGFAVACFDLIGSGSRTEEIAGFYRRYPQWSLMGSMLRDARSAIDALAAYPWLDHDRLMTVGYATGAMTAAFLAASEPRITATALINPPSPFRLDPEPAHTGGTDRWGRDSLLIPALGRYAGREREIPWDLTDAIAALAPRPLLLVTTEVDHAITPEQRAALVAAAAPASLTHRHLESWNHFGLAVKEDLLLWLRAQGPMTG